MFILNSETNRIVQKEISFTPGLYKIFDEILVSVRQILGLNFRSIPHGEIDMPT